MIEVKDRIPTKPNRIRIVPENGAPFYATWERADEPIEEGTPVNKYLFDSIDEGGHFSNALDDIEIDAQRVTLAAGWMTVSFPGRRTSATTRSRIICMYSTVR